MKSTVKLLGCPALFTIEWLALAVFAAVRVGPLLGVLVLLVCPAAGYTTVRFAERAHDVGGFVHGYRA